MSEDFDVLDNAYSLLAKISAIDADADGISVRLGTRMLPAVTYGVVADGTGPSGFPSFGYALPSLDTGTSGTNLAVSTDFINQVLFAFFEGGLLNRTLTSEDLGLDAATISLLMPGLTDMIIATEPLLPPVAMPRSDAMAEPSDGADSADSYNYDLQLGDVYVAVYNGEETEEDLYMSLYVSTVAPMSLSSTGDGTGLTLDIGEPTVKVDVVATSPDYAVSTEATESLFADLMPLYLPEITGAIGEVPLPSVGGFSLSSVSSSMVGGDATPGFFMLTGDLD